MEKTAGEKAEQFIAWLEQARAYLPFSMRISEAWELFERRLQDEDTLRNEQPQQAEQNAVQEPQPAQESDAQ